MGLLNAVYDTADGIARSKETQNKRQKAKLAAKRKAQQ